MADEPEKRPLVGYPRPEPDFIRGLGAVTLEYSQLEGVLKFEIAALLRNPKSKDRDDKEIYQAVTAPLGFRELLDVFAGLFQHRCAGNEALIVESRKVIAAIAKASEERNRVIHSMWITTKDPSIGAGLRIKVKRRKGVESAIWTTTPGELQGLAGSIREALYGLRWLMREYSEWVYGPPDEGPEEEEEEA